MRVYDHFPRTALAAGPVKFGMLAQLFGFAKNQIGQLIGGNRVVFRDVQHDFYQVVIRLPFPFKPAHVSSSRP